MINLWRFHKSRSSFGLHAKNGTKIIQTDTLWHAIWPFPNLQCCQKLSWGNIRSINSPFKNIRAAYYQTTKNQNLKNYRHNFNNQEQLYSILGNIGQFNTKLFLTIFFCSQRISPCQFFRVLSLFDKPTVRDRREEKVVWKWRVGHRIVFHCAEINWKRWGVVKRRLMGKIYYSSLWWKNWRPL